MNKVLLGDIKKVLLYLTFPLMLTGCGKKAECNYPNRHAHLYVKSFDKNGIDNKPITIKKYLISEYLNTNGYERKEDRINVTTENELYLSKIKNYFKIKDNWPYMYNLMSNYHDFIEFYYRYTTIETYVTTDSKGNTHVHTRTETHTGWTDNPYYSHNTGKFHIGHHRFRGFRIEKKYKSNGRVEITLEHKSADDIRVIMKEYPYATDFDDEVEIVYKEYNANKSELPKIRPDDPRYNTFKHPYLSNITMNLNSNSNNKSNSNTSTNQFNPNQAFDVMDSNDYFNPNTITEPNKTR